MKNRNLLLTLFLLCAFFLQTATLGFALDSEEPTSEQEAAEKAYHQSLTNLNTKNEKKRDIKDDVNKLVKSIEAIANGTHQAELTSLGSSLLTAAALLSGAAATSIAAQTAAAIVGSKNAVDIVLGSLDANGLNGTVQDLLRGLYNLETELIKQTEAVQAQAEKVNTKLSEWEATLPAGEKPVFDDEEVEPIDVSTRYPDHSRSLSDPPSYPSDTTETIACPECGEQVPPPYLVAKVTSGGGLIMGVEYETVYRGHEVSCAETRHSTGNACEGEYYSCPTPKAGTVTVCPHDADHRVVGPCPDGSEKHEYAKGSPGDHNQRVVCGADAGCVSHQLIGQTCSRYLSGGGLDVFTAWSFGSHVYRGGIFGILGSGRDVCVCESDV